jgi:predicted RND superfamily exporter protein
MCSTFAFTTNKRLYEKEKGTVCSESLPVLVSYCSYSGAAKKRFEWQCDQPRNYPETSEERQEFEEMEDTAGT